MVEGLSRKKAAELLTQRIKELQGQVFVDQSFDLLESFKKVKAKL